MPTRRFRTTLTARLLLEYRDHILFLAQTKSNGGGYSLPGGKIEGFEFAKEAVIRETFEEIGVNLLPKNVKFIHVAQKKMASSIEIIFFFRAAVWEGEPIVKEPDRFHNFVWIPNDELPGRVNEVIASVLKKIKKGKSFSQFSKEKAKEKKAKRKKKSKSKPDKTPKDILKMPILVTELLNN